MFHNRVSFSWQGRIAGVFSALPPIVILDGDQALTGFYRQNLFLEEKKHDSIFPMDLADQSYVSESKSERC